MNIQELQQKLKENHLPFIRHIKELPDTDFLYSHNSKWTAGQQLEHIVKSVGPVALALSLPGFMLKLVFGKSNRPSRSYDQLIEKYKTKLEAGYKSNSRFAPHPVTLEQRDSLLKKLFKSIHTLSGRINTFSEKQLDTLILPHPLLGKLTLREMLYFTIYHVTHHERQVIEHLKKKTD